MEILLGQNINIEQSQKLTLTPEMIQSLNILQFSASDLIEYISEQAYDNPVIELDSGDVYLQEVLREKDNEIYHEGENVLDRANPDDWDAGDWYDFSEEMNRYSQNSYGKYSMDLQDSYNNQYEYNMCCEITLEESLMEQLELSDERYIIKAVAAYVIQIMDENGYLTESLEDIANELHISSDQMEDGLKLVQTFDPPGVGARNLKECLILQLKRIDRYDDTIERIIVEHLENIAMNRVQLIAKNAGISIWEAQEYADLLRSLEPKPGRIFSSYEKTRFIVPDVVVEERDGSMIVTLNQRSIPKISIRNEYRELIKKHDKNSNVVDFLSTHFNSAKWLMRSIEQRNQTILKVTKEIVDVQGDFFKFGKSALKPLNMKDIAEEIGVHESTVSRAVNGKYLQSCQGVFELKYFFSGAGRFSGKNGQDTSSEAVKNLIENIVNGESKTAPLSDRAIAEAITVTGVDISRRTVAKYREEMGIPSSPLRRRVK